MPLFQAFSHLNGEHEDPIAIPNTARTGSITNNEGEASPCLALALPERAQLVYTLKEVRDLQGILQQFLKNVADAKMTAKPINIVKRANGQTDEP